MLVGASELYALVVANAEVLSVGWGVVRQGAEAAVLGAAKALEDPKARVREARIMRLREAAIVVMVREQTVNRIQCDCVELQW